MAVDGAAQALVANHPLKPRHFKTHKLDAASADLVTGRQLLLGNDDVRISYVVADTPSPLYRNAAGDELRLRRGRRGDVLETVFGALQVGSGDYVVLPTSTTHRWVPTGGRAGARAGRSRRAGTSTPPQALPVREGPVPRAGAVLRARPARPDRAADRGRAATSTCSCGTAPA